MRYTYTCNRWFNHFGWKTLNNEERITPALVERLAREELSIEDCDCPGRMRYQYTFEDSNGHNTVFMVEHHWYRRQRPWRVVNEFRAREAVPHD